MSVPPYLLHKPSGFYFQPVQQWTYTAQPGVTTTVYGPMVNDVVVGRAVIPYPVASPYVKTLDGFDGYQPFPMAATSVIDPPPPPSLPEGFLIYGTTYAITGTPGVVVPLPPPFDVLHLTLPEITASMADWVAQTPQSVGIPTDW